MVREGRRAGGLTGMRILVCWAAWRMVVYVAALVEMVAPLRGSLARREVVNEV